MSPRCRHEFSLRAGRPRFFQLTLCMLLAGQLGAVSHRLEAAPVTFQFEAEVASVLPSRGGADLPFAISVGDSLITTFTFEPASGGPDYSQSELLQFEINDEIIAIMGYNISVRNDAPFWVELRGRIADPAHTPIDDRGPGGSSDNIALSCLASSTPEDFHCGSVPGRPELMFRPLISLSNDDDLIHSDGLTSDLNTWNGFSFREMSLSFVNMVTGGETYVGAFIGTIRQITEPPTGSVAIIGGVIYLYLVLCTNRLRA